jgi:hypothetical protein
MKRCVIVFAHCVTWSGGAVIVNFISQWFYYRSGRYHPQIWIERLGWLRFFSCKITQRVKGNIEKSCAWGFNSIYWTHIKSFSIIMRSCISVTAWRDVYIFWCLFDGFYQFNWIASGLLFPFSDPTFLFNGYTQLNPVASSIQIREPIFVRRSQNVCVTGSNKSTHVFVI